jgi:Tol biopolymer transport system component
METNKFFYSRWVLRVIAGGWLVATLLLLPALLLGQVMPRGDQVAFMYSYDFPQDWDIYLMDMRVGIGQPITHTEAYERYPEWSPDGEQLIYHSNPRQPQSLQGPFDLFRLSEIGAEPQLLDISRSPFYDDLNESMVSWSPDGERLAFHQGGPSFDYRIVISDVDGESYSIPVDTKDGTDLIYATWSPDGTRLAFVLSELQNNSSFTNSSTLYVLDVGENVEGEVGQMRPLLTSNDVILFPEWSPTGDQIVYTTGPNQGQEIHQIDADGGNMQVLVRSSNADVFNTHASWLPDGSGIVFSSNRDGGLDYDLYVMDNDGASIRQITDLPGDELAADWRPRP